MNEFDICFGTNKMDKNSISLAIESGYKYLDTATGYNNASIIKEAINGKKIMIIGKFNPFDFTNQFDNIVDNYINDLGQIPDIVLLHSPLSLDSDYLIGDTNEKNLLAFEKLRKKFPCSQIGVSNFSIPQIQYLLNHNVIVDCIELELSPYYQPLKLISFCFEMNIKIYSYRLTSKSAVFNDQKLKHISMKYGISVMELLINWCLNQKICPIISSKNPKNIKNNISLKKIQLTKEDCIQINALNKGDQGSTCMLSYTQHDY